MKMIEAVVSPQLLEQLAARIESETGLSFPASKRRDLMNALCPMSGAAGFDHEEECIEWLLNGAWSWLKTDLCARYLTIGETYFFREPRAFDLVCDYARTKMDRMGCAGTHVRIWSAGCCTGEEAYSLAMALRYEVPQLNPHHIFILGTDINSQSLQVARDGEYRQWSFRNNHRALQSHWFDDAGENKRRVSKQIRDMVRFAELNLIDPVYPSALMQAHDMDIIFCRNVLMYFSRSQARRVIERLRRCLVDGGWLVVSPSEASAELFAGFTATYFPDAIYFRKTDDPGIDDQEQAASHVMTVGGGSEGSEQLRAESLLGKPEKRASAMPVTTNAPPTDAEAAVQAHDPFDAALYHAKAMLAMERGDHREAAQNLKHVIYLKPDSILARYLLGIVQLARSRTREAIRQLEAVHEMLTGLPPDEIVPASEGWSVAYLRDSVRAYLEKGHA